MSVSSTQLSEKAAERTECGAELHLQIAQLQPRNAGGGTNKHRAFSRTPRIVWQKTLSVGRFSESV
jgi:hypothetical protein